MIRKSGQNRVSDLQHLGDEVHSEGGWPEGGVGDTLMGTRAEPAVLSGRPAQHLETCPPTTRGDTPPLLFQDRGGAAGGRDAPGGPARGAQELLRGGEQLGVRGHVRSHPGGNHTARGPVLLNRGPLFSISLGFPSVVVRLYVGLTHTEPLTLSAKKGNARWPLRALSPSRGRR